MHNFSKKQKKNQKIKKNHIRFVDNIKANFIMQILFVMQPPPPPPSTN